jgi:hypothetical protein
MTALANKPETITLPDLSGLSIDELKEMFATGLRQTADGLLTMAAAYAELQRRGESLARFKLGGFLDTLTFIASGKLLPESALYFGDQPVKLKAFTKLSIDKQRELLESDEVIVVEGDTEKPVPLRELNARKMPQVFGDDGTVRTPKEQKKYVEGKYNPRPKPVERTPHANPIMEMAHNGQPRDVGETACEMIKNSTNPKEAMFHFINAAEEAGLI